MTERGGNKLSHGADPNVKDNGGNTPLHLAAARGHDDVVDILLRTCVTVCFVGGRLWLEGLFLI